MAKTTRIPLRSCKACRSVAPKQKLMRWVMVDGQPALDTKSNIEGRGAYVCSDDCYNKIAKQLPNILTRRRR